MEKTFYEQPIDSAIKRWKEKKKVSGQRENHATKYFLNYDYIKNHYWLMTVDFRIKCWSKSNSANRIWYKNTDIKRSKAQSFR